MFPKRPFDELSSPSVPRPTEVDASDRKEHSNMRLPSVSSLLPRNEHSTGSGRHSDQFAPISYPPSYFNPNHPLFLSDMNPSTPPQFIHHSSHPSHSANTIPPSYSQYLPSLPTRSSLDSMAPTSHTPVAQRRQARKISQRRADIPKQFVHIDNRSSALFEVHPHDQKTTPNTIVDMKRSDSSMSQEQPIKETQSKALSISGLLSGDVRYVMEGSAEIAPISGLSRGNVDRPPPQYSFSVRQQPISARACGFGERDRRVVDPPPILVLAINDPAASAEELSARLRSRVYVVHCSLWNPVTDEDEMMMPMSDRKQQRRLVGTLVGSPFYGKDNGNVEQCFFPFADLSVRTAGTYCLKFKLLVLDYHNMRHGDFLPAATAKSNPFTVLNAKDFEGMRPSTELTKCLKAQGCLIPVKKGNSKTNVSRLRDEDEEDQYDDDEEDGNDADDMGTAPKRLKVF